MDPVNRHLANQPAMSSEEHSTEAQPMKCSIPPLSRRALQGALEVLRYHCGHRDAKGRVNNAHSSITQDLEDQFPTVPTEHHLAQGKSKPAGTRGHCMDNFETSMGCLPALSPFKRHNPNLPKLHPSHASRHSLSLSASQRSTNAAGPAKLPEDLPTQVLSQIDLFEERLQNFKLPAMFCSPTSSISDTKTLTSNGSPRMETQASSIVARLFQLQILQKNHILQKARNIDRNLLVTTFQSHCCDGSLQLSQFHRMWQELLGKEADWWSAEMIFNLCNKNSNGNVSLSEFLRRTDLLLLPQNNEAVLQYFFQLLCGKGRCNTFVSKFDVDAILVAFESLQLPGRAAAQEQEVSLKAAVLRRRIQQLPWEADSRLELGTFQQGILQDAILRAAFVRETPDAVPGCCTE
eukprot:GGOE01023754.1.p1 GENE.GGOE01023754.1~~GGOE01023754.1.p1  ORF type:complete len:406 (-),score=99.00 GGOE01023754.1:97-1314(-)